MKTSKFALIASAALVLSGCLFDFPDPTVDPARVTLNDRAVHDPSVIRADDGSFYVFGSHLAAARSTGDTQAPAGLPHAIPESR